MELLIGHHVEVAGAGETEDNGLCLAGLLALHGLVDGYPDGVAGLGSREDALDPGKLLGGFKHLGLLHGHGLHVAVVVQLGEDAAHAVIPQTAGVVGRGNEVAAQGVHFCQGAHHAGVAEVIGKLAPGETGAGGGLHGDEPVVLLTPELFTHEGGDQTAQVAAASGAADDDVGHNVVLIQRRLGLQADDTLVQQYLVEDAAQHVAVARGGGGDLHGLGNSAAQGAGGAGMLLEDLPADGGSLRGRGGNGSAVGPHDLSAEGLLLVADLHHVDLAVQAQVCASHGQGRAPLAGAGLGGNALEALLLGIIGLGNGAVQLVGAGGIVALKLVVDFGGGAQGLFQAVGPYQGRGTVHLVEIQDLLGNGDLPVIIVQLLADQLVAEHRAQVLKAHRLSGAGIQQGSGLDLHVSPDIVPCLGYLIFGEINFVGNVVDFGCHGAFSFHSS